MLAGLAFGALLICGACGGETEPGNERSPREAPKASAAESSGAPAASGAGFHLGEPRQDLERFYGLYGETGGRQFFVTQATKPKFAEQAPDIPPGYLAVGAMWGDVAPMHMKSLGESKFEQVDLSDFAPHPLHVVEFELGPDGKAVALTFTRGALSEYGRRERVGDLPEGF